MGQVAASQSPTGPTSASVQSNPVASTLPTPAPPPELTVVGMTKRFGALTALEDVSLRLVPGAFHALLGENGAGKSTLVKCIMGYHQPDHGKIFLDGVECVISSPRDAYGLGIGMVYQNFSLVPNMTVAENLLLPRPDLPAVIDWSSEITRMKRFLAGMPFRIDLEALAASLSAGEKQKVEILKQLFLGSRILILDEPTSVLTPDETDELLGLLRDMAAARQISVLMITHKLREVMSFAREVTILRHGRLVGSGAVSALSAGDMTKMMIGSEILTAPAGRAGSEGGIVRLELRKVCADNDRGKQAISALSLSVKSHEIVGVAGISGNGQRELVEVIAGQREPTSGAIFVHGKEYRAARAEMRREKVFCLPEEPLRNACVGSMTIAENLVFRTYDRPPFVTASRLVKNAEVRRAAEQQIRRFHIRPPIPEALVESLSGGNVQRLVLARELSGDVEVLVAANPCMGLDVAAISEIRDQIMRTRNRGAAVLLVSEDLDELFELADRITVMFEGKIVYETPIANSDRSIIGRHMAGQ
jgi:general nucleoside transport system ATP-binding protein